MRYRVTVETLNIRSGPNTASKVVGTLTLGETIPALDWLPVLLEDNSIGWVSLKFLEEAPEEPEEEVPGAEYPWMPIARSKLGEAELPGAPANPEILDYLYSTTLDGPDKESDETPWCSAFVNWCVEQAGVKGTDSAWARSWLNWGQAADIGNLLPGAIVVLERGPTSGHVGFFVDAAAENIQLLGGNQGNKVSLSWFPQSRVLGVRIPT